MTCWTLLIRITAESIPVNFDQVLILWSFQIIIFSSLSHPVRNSQSPKKAADQTGKGMGNTAALMGKIEFQTLREKKKNRKDILAEISLYHKMYNLWASPSPLPPLGLTHPLFLHFYSKKGQASHRLQQNIACQVAVRLSNLPCI